MTKHSHFRQLLIDLAEANGVSQGVLVKEATYTKNLISILRTDQFTDVQALGIEGNDRICTVIHRDLGMMFVQLICPSLGLAYANVLNRYFAGQVRILAETLIIHRLLLKKVDKQPKRMLK